MKANRPNFCICIANDGYRASLQVRTIYQQIEDSEAESHGMLRIIDESGEDYLFPKSYFVPIEVPEEATKVFPGAA